jgi:hypothetical protein
MSCIAITPRTFDSCKHRWGSTLDPTLASAEFSAEEDASLLRLVGECGPAAWEHISARFSGRSGLQLYRRWRSIADRDVIKSHTYEVRKRRKTMASTYLKTLGKSSLSSSDFEEVVKVDVA